MFPINLLIWWTENPPVENNIVYEVMSMFYGSASRFKLSFFFPPMSLPAQEATCQPVVNLFPQGHVYVDQQSRGLIFSGGGGGLCSATEPSNENNCVVASFRKLLLTSPWRLLKHVVPMGDFYVSHLHVFVPLFVPPLLLLHFMVKLPKNQWKTFGWLIILNTKYYYIV